MKQRKTIVILLCALLAAAVAICCAGCGAQKNSSITCLEDMKDMELQFGYPDSLDLTKEIYQVCPGAELCPQSDIMAIGSVSTGKLDCYAEADFYLDGYMQQHPDSGLRVLDEPLIVYDIALGVSNSTPIENYAVRVNEAIAKLRQEGTLDDMNRRWIDGEDDTMPEISLPENPEYTLAVVTYGQQKPYSYMKDNELTGYDVELATRIAAYLGCGIRIDTAGYTSMLLGIAEGKYDMIASNLFVTPERAESLTFSEPYNQCTINIVVRDDASGADVYNSLEELQQAKRFGNVTGTVFDEITLSYFPNVEIRQYGTLIDEVAALSAGKIDALLYDAPTLEYICAEHSDVKLLPELLETENYHILSQKSEKGERLMEEFNSWLEQSRADGTLKEIEEFWLSAESPEGRISFATLPENAETVYIGCDEGSRPDSFYYKGQPVGYTVEIGVRFCNDRGYKAELVQTKADAFINSLNSGKIDVFVGLMSYTEERAQNVTYSEPIMSGGVGVLVRSGENSGESVWEKLGQGFYKTFISESRWKLLLSGLGVTMLVTLGGFLLANALGAGFCALAMSKRRALRKIEELYSRLMQGTPIVVVLMILYYVIFGKSKINGIGIAILGFGLSGGAGLSQMFYGGITAVDKGQREASLALGFTRAQTFFGITLPQAIRTILPGYFSDLISMMKGTAIVGYIAVVDMTKASDIIRSSTYEAFFPLISVAVIYFIISWILLSIMKSIQNRLAPKRRTAAEVKK